MAAQEDSRSQRVIEGTVQQNGKLMSHDRYVLMQDMLTGWEHESVKVVIQRTNK